MNPTASERLLDAWASVSTTLGNLSPAGVAIDAGLSIVIVAIAWVIGIVAARFLRGLSRRLPGPATAEKMVRTSRLARLVLFSARVALMLGAAALIASVWGFDVVGWASQGAGRRVVATAAHLTLLLLIAAAAVEISGFAIGRALQRMTGAGVEARRKAQIRTLGPLLRGASQTAIVIVAVLMALGELGVEVGPLLAGAGVVGIALGFGAQTLVKDLLTGVFLIIEDIVSVGDIVRINGSSGLVERMTLRTIRLRDFDGTLHVFPYGEAQVVHNLTKTFSYYVFDLQVSYGSDIDKALRIMRDVGERLQRDPDFREKILEPIEVVGVDNLADSGVVLKARIKTQPTQQWSVGREYNRRIKQAFDRAGIEIPFPHMKVVLPERQLGALAAQHAGDAA